jgi:hypothetical protein
VKVLSFIRGDLPEIMSLPAEVRVAVHAAAIKNIRRRSFFLRFLPELCGFIGALLGYTIVATFAPRGVITPHGPVNPELFQQLMLWNMFAPPPCILICAWIGMHIRNRFLRRQIPIVIEDCAVRISSDRERAD